jgi:hypothetical protein
VDLVEGDKQQAGPSVWQMDRNHPTWRHPRADLCSKPFSPCDRPKGQCQEHSCISQHGMSYGTSLVFPGPAVFGTENHGIGRICRFNHPFFSVYLGEGLQGKESCRYRCMYIWCVHKYKVYKSTTHLRFSLIGHDIAQDLYNNGVGKIWGVVCI